MQRQFELKYAAGMLCAFVLLAATLQAFPHITRATGNTYYVATTGSDTDPGTLAQPWRTIQKAANTVNPGDTVYVRGGTYNEAVRVTRSGAAGAFITFAAYPGETPVLNLNGMVLSDYFDAGFRVHYAAYVRIRGFVVQNVTDGFGIICYHADNCIVENNRTYNTRYSGIASWTSTNTVIQNNEVELANNDGEQENITVTQSAHVQVLNNHVHHGGPGTNGGEGIDVKDGSHDVLVKGNYVHDLNRLCLYVDAWDSPTYNITLDGNRAHSCFRYGIALASERGGELSNVTIVNNVMFRNVRTGIVIGDWDAGYPHPIHDVLIINNTVYDNGDGKWGGGIEVMEPSVQRITIRNNIVSQNDFFTILADGVPASALTVDHNLIEGFRGQTGELRGTDYVEGDPRFVDAAAFDFHLLPDSPAIDRGSADSAPDHDYDAAPRPRNGLWDIGAYEYQSGPQPPTNTPTPAAPTNTPAPILPTNTPTSVSPTNTFTPTLPFSQQRIVLPLILYKEKTPPLAPPTNTPTPVPSTNTPTPTPPSSQQRIFFDGFETTFPGSWYTEGAVTWYTGSPKIGTHSVRHASNNTWMQRTGISTVGYRDIVLRVYMGAASFEASEVFKVYYKTGSSWVVLDTIMNGDPEEDGQLHYLEFALPGSANNISNLGVAFALQSADTSDYGYIDNVEVLGAP